ncbi:MAG: hypothetical protein J6K81_03765 [Rikenellaceae bacterium]|nr:hypothetical protein [Rikenellaceae bacterium]
MASFKEYITARGEADDTKEPKVGRWELFRIIHKYPWFTTARKVRVRLYENEDERVYLSQLFPVPENRHNQEELREEIENKVVDNFLALGKYAISRPEEDGKAESLVSEVENSDDDDDFFTEELAQIYENQGLWLEARNIYVKLSLREPKKSVYFAEIIARLDEKL